MLIERHRARHLAVTVLLCLSASLVHLVIPLVSDTYDVYQSIASRLVRQSCAATTLTSSGVGGSGLLSGFSSLHTQASVMTTTTKQLSTPGSNMPDGHHFTVSYVTAPTESVARDLAKGLVKLRLAACVNIVKTVESVYEWRDKVAHDNETLMIIKSDSTKSRQLADFVEKNHPYECPEVITLRIETGSENYLKWIRDTLSKAPLPPAPSPADEGAGAAAPSSNKGSSSS